MYGLVLSLVPGQTDECERGPIALNIVYIYIYIHTYIYIYVYIYYSKKSPILDNQASEKEMKSAHSTWLGTDVPAWTRILFEMVSCKVLQARAIQATGA